MTQGNSQETSQELTQLQGKYVAGVAAMTEAEVRRFHDLLTHAYDAPYRERRLEVLTRRIAVIDRQARVEQAEKDEHKALMQAKRDFYAITDGWEAQGAVRRSLHDNHVETWAYEGEEIYRWGGGYRPTMHEMLADAQRIDEVVFGKGAIG